MLKCKPTYRKSCLLCCYDGTQQDTARRTTFFLCLSFSQAFLSSSLHLSVKCSKQCFEYTLGVIANVAIFMWQTLSKSPRIGNLCEISDISLIASKILPILAKFGPKSPKIVAFPCSARLLPLLAVHGENARFSLSQNATRAYEASFQCDLHQSLIQYTQH